MDNTFSRAATGFVVLTAAISLMAMVALWAIERYGGGVWWAALIVVLVALVAVASTYGSTLHDPIRDWIKEPERIANKQHETFYIRDAIKSAIEAHENEYHEVRRHG